MTTLGLLIRLCGMSQQETCEYVGVSLDSIRSWSSGRTPTPEHAIVRMRKLYDDIQEVVTSTMEQISEVPESKILTFPLLDDPETIRQNFGLPNPGSYSAVLAFVAARSKRRVIVHKAIVGSLSAAELQETGEKTPQIAVSPSVGKSTSQK